MLAPGSPGASAHAHAERLKTVARDKLGRRLHRVLVVSVASFVGIGLGLALIIAAPSQAWRVDGVLVVVASAMVLAGDFYLAMDQLIEIEQRVDSQTDPAMWLKGALGEQQTALLLEPLRHEGFVILHDRRQPESSGNIDHIVVGPSGIFVIETKNWQGTISTDGQELYCNRTDAFAAKSALATRAISQAQGEARAVWSATGASHWVSAIVVIHGATMAEPQYAVQKSFVVRPDHLLGFVRAARGYTLAPDEVGRLARMADRALPPYVEAMPAAR